MANQKVTQLCSITNAQLASGDVFLVSDISCCQSKKITVAQLDVRYASCCSSGLAISTQTCNYCVTACDRILIGNTACNNITFSLPTAVCNEGKEYTITKRQINTDFNSITIDGSGCQTIGSKTSIKLFGAGESVTFVSDNSNWVITDWTPSEQMSYQPSHNCSTNTCVVQAYVTFQRMNMEIDGIVTWSCAAGCGNLLVEMPGCILIDTSRLPGGTDNSGAGASLMSTAAQYLNGTYVYVFSAFLNTSSFWFQSTSGSVLQLSSFSSGDDFRYKLEAPVT